VPNIRWGIVHTDKFWRENARLVEQDEFKLLKLLISLLSSKDSVRSSLPNTAPFLHYT
jgi:V-ATPase subunit H